MVPANIADIQIISHTHQNKDHKSQIRIKSSCVMVVCWGEEGSVRLNEVAAVIRGDVVDVLDVVEVDIEVEDVEDNVEVVNVDVDVVVVVDSEVEVLVDKLLALESETRAASFKFKQLAVTGLLNEQDDTKIWAIADILC